MGHGCLSGPLQKDRFLTLHGPVLQEPDGDDVPLGEIVDVSDGLTFVSGQGYAVLVESVPLVGADDDDIRSTTTAKRCPSESSRSMNLRIALPTSPNVEFLGTRIFLYVERWLTKLTFRVYPSVIMPTMWVPW